MKMRKWFLAFAGLLISANAQAHMLGSVPFSDIGSLDDVTHHAAFAIFQTALSSRVQVNFAAAPYNAACNNTDDTAAFLAFKAAYQGTTPVQLNLPNGTCVFTPSGGGSNPAFYPFKGIADLVVSGNGVANTTFKSPTGIQVGGAGQFQDGNHSVRTNTAIPGDSCVTLKTPPASTVTNVTSALPYPASFTATIPFGAQFSGSQTGTTLTVTAVSAGTIRAGGFLRFAGGPAGGTSRSIVAQLTGTGGAPCPDATCTGGVGTYSVSASGSGGINETTGNILNVTAIGSGTIAAGAYLITPVTNGISGLTSIQAFGTGGTTGTGGTGTYALNNSASYISASSNVNTVPATFTGTVTQPGVLTVTAMIDGVIAVGMDIFRDGGGVSQSVIKSQLTGTGGAPCPDATCNGGVGTYQFTAGLANAQPTPANFYGGGVVRVTLSSTAGLSNNDTLYISGIVGTGQLRANGLQIIKVVNGTQIDLIQNDFNGGYTSGGVAGGDRTSLFPVGSKVIMTGWTNQAYWAGPSGYPSNPQWFEYKTVASVNSTTHQVCFDTPLTETYKDTWPQYNTGNGFQVDQGGPATLYVLDPSWEMTAVFQNFTMDTNGQSYANARNVTFSNVTMASSFCPIPTQNETHTWTNVDASNCNIETDKIVKTWNMTNSSARNVHIQSSSLETINANTVTFRQLSGTSKKFIGNNITVTGGDFQIGTANYGASEETSCTNCNISAGGIGTATPITRVDYPGFEWSMSGGVITIPNALSNNPAAGAQNPGGEIQTRGLVPGSYNFWRGSQVGRAFKVVDVTQDIDNTYVQTSEAGGFPTGTWTASGLSVFPHPAPKLTSVNWSGDYRATAFNGCPAQSPMYSCQTYVYTGGATGTIPSTMLPLVWGEMDTWTFTNNVPYTGAGTLTWSMASIAQGYLTTSNTQGSVTEIINMKLPSSCGSCTRTLTPSGATNTQVGDNLNAAPAGAVFGGTGTPVFSANTPSDSPQITIVLKTNQNLP